LIPERYAGSFRKLSHRAYNQAVSRRGSAVSFVLGHVFRGFIELALP